MPDPIKKDEYIKEVVARKIEEAKKEIQTNLLQEFKRQVEGTVK